MSAEEEIKQEALRTPAVSTGSILLETSLGALVIDLFGADCPALTAHFANLVRCKFWHGCTACELIPDIAVFFAHRDDTAYEAALTTQLQRSTVGHGGDSFYALLDHAREDKDKQVHTMADSKASAESVAAIAEEGRLACKRCCTTIDVPRALLTDQSSNTQSSSNCSARRVFQRVTGAGPGAVCSPALLHRAGLLIVDHTIVNNDSNSTASCRMKFGLTLSNRNMDFLAARYVAIGQVREGWLLLLRRLRTLPCRDVPAIAQGEGHTSNTNNTSSSSNSSVTMSIVLPGAPRWPRPIRLLRIKHCTVLPTPGTERYRDITAGSSNSNNDNTTRIGGVAPYDVRGSLPDVSARATSSSSSSSSRHRAHEQQQMMMIKAKLGTILHSAGCFRFWASAQDIARANATLRALLAPCQPPMLVLIPTTTHASTKANREDEGEDDDEVRSIEYNAHYSGCYLSSDEELGGISATNRGDKQQQAASQQSSEKARKALREAAQQLHEEKANETLALMLNVLNRVADVKGDIAPPENVLFVCKLNPVTTGEGLAMCFAQFGEVVSAEVIMDRKTGQSLCYGFVEFASVEACYRAFQKMDKALIDDSRIHVDFSQSVSKLWAQRQREMRKRPRPA